MERIGLNGVFDEFVGIKTEDPDEFRWIWDIQDECFVYISPSVSKILGFTVEEAMSKKIWEYMPAESVKKIYIFNFSRILKVFKEGKSNSVTLKAEKCVFYCKDGTLKNTITKSQIVLNPKDNSVYMLAASKEISTMIRWDETLDKSEHVVRVYCFEKFMVYGPDKTTPIKWRTKKAEELAAFIMHNHKMKLEKWKIYEALWPNSDAEKVKNALHMSIYWLKKAFQDAQIPFSMKYQNGVYYIEAFNFFSDVYVLDQIIQNGIVSLAPTDYFKICNYRKAVMLYDNDYLALNDYPWAVKRKGYYNTYFFKICTKLVEFYMNEQNYESAKVIIDKMLDIDFLCEDAHEFLLKLYLIEKDYSRFLKHYKELRVRLNTELKVLPRNSIEKLHTEYLRQKRS